MPRPDLLRPALAALWAVLALVNYYQHHPLRYADLVRVVGRPIPHLTAGGFALLASRAAPALAVLAAEALAALGLGLVATRWAGFGRALTPLRGFFSLLSGLGLLPLLVLAAGWLGFFSAGSYAVVLAVGLAAGAASRPGRPPPRRPPAPGRLFTLPGAMGLAAALIAVGAALLSNLTPPHVSDELVYHLGNAHWHLANGRIAPQPGLFNAAMPQMGSLLFGAPLAFGLLHGSKLMHWLAGGAALWGVDLLLRRVPAGVRWSVLGVLATMPLVWVQAGRAFTDLFLCAFGAGALLAAARARRAGGGGRSVAAALAGACVGFAGGFKYNGLLLALPLLVLLPVRALPLAGASAAFWMGPWFTRAFLHYGNPVYPHGFGGLGWDDHLAWRRAKSLFEGELTVTDRLADLPLLPWNFTVVGAGGPDSAVGPLLAAGIGLLVLAAPRRELLALGAFLLPCALVSAYSRYVLPALPLVLLLLARGLAAVPDARRRSRAAAAGFGVLLLAQAAEVVTAGWGYYDDPVPHLTGRETVTEYLDRRLYPPLYYPRTTGRLYAALPAELPPASRLLVLGGYGGALYLPGGTLFGAVVDRPLPLALLREADSPRRVAIRMRQLSLTHVLLNRWQSHVFFDAWRMWDWRSGAEVVRWRDAWDAHAREAWRLEPDYVLYAWSRDPLPPEPQLTPGVEEEELRLALYRIRTKELDVADRQLTSLRGLFPANPLVWLRTVQLRARQGRFADAAAARSRLAGLVPAESPLLRRADAELAWTKGRHARAAALLAPVLRAEPGDSQGWADLYSLYTILGNDPLAAAAKREYERTKFP